LLLAQLENVDFFISKKREKAQLYQEHFDSKDGYMVKELTNTLSNYWLNALFLDERHSRDEFLAYANKNGVMVRPIWNLLSHLEHFKDCVFGDLSNAINLENRIVNLPSSIN
jgi:perosamine synthetase